MKKTHPVHPRGVNATILFTSVFGPYARDDEYGSRFINPMELYQNQVTKVQGPFSLRMFNRSFGLVMIKENIDAPSTLLDFPTMERFIEELQTHSYDIVGISSIFPNYRKVKKMCELIRTFQPDATIVVGGHIANMPDLHTIIDADHIVKGDGVRWFRQFLGQNPDAPIRHPAVYSAFGTRSLGITFRDNPGDTAAVLIPSVGCPVGCNFCSTSAFFGGKGRFIEYYTTGDELFSVICELEEKLRVRSFFIMDENFLLHKKKVLRLLRLMKQHHKSWSFYVFSSARVIRSYKIEQLVRLGISWVWIGLEGKDSQYAKLHGVDTKALIATLQSHGIRVLGSSIIGLENHTPETMKDIIDYAVSHDTDFHQFMLYMPLPGTPLYEQNKKDGMLLSKEECDAADMHGQCRFNYRHRHIPAGQETDLLNRAFQQDFLSNGPSIARMIRTGLMGWKKYKNHPDPCVKDRIHWQSNELGTIYAGVMWAIKKWYNNDMHMVKKMDAILRDIYQEFGLISRILAPLIGRLAFFTIQRESKRLKEGWTYEPPTIYEKNDRARALENSRPFPAVIRTIPAFNFNDRLVPTFDVMQRMKTLYYTFRDSRFKRAASKATPVSRDAPLLITPDILKIEIRKTNNGHHPLSVDLYGSFNRITAGRLGKSMKRYLKMHDGGIGINFRHLDFINRNSLLGFLRKLRVFGSRITFSGFNVIQSHFADEAAYVTKYFKVIKKVNQELPATGIDT